MKNTLHINATSFYQTHFKKLNWTFNDQTENGEAIHMEEESLTDESEVNEAIEDHIDHITAALPEGRVLNDYEVTLDFDKHISDLEKKEFTTLFNAFNTRDESN